MNKITRHEFLPFEYNEKEENYFGDCVFIEDFGLFKKGEFVGFLRLEYEKIICGSHLFFSGELIHWVSRADNNGKASDVDVREQKFKMRIVLCLN